MQSTIRHRTFRAAQALAAEGIWGGRYLKPFESAEIRALKNRANRLYAIGELQEAAELLTQIGPAAAPLEVPPGADASCDKTFSSRCDRCGQPFFADPD
jgi:hypothetical protein